MNFELTPEDRAINLRNMKRNRLAALSMIFSSIQDGRHAFEYLQVLGEVGSSYHQNRRALEMFGANMKEID